MPGFFTKMKHLLVTNLLSEADLATGRGGEKADGQRDLSMNYSLIPPAYPYYPASPYPYPSYPTYEGYGRWGKPGICA